MQASEYRNIKEAAIINTVSLTITIPSDEGINVFPRRGTDQVLPEYQDNLSQELGSVACRLPDNGFKVILTMVSGDTEQWFSKDKKRS